MYGLTKKNKKDVFKKIEKQRDFLFSHYIEVSGEKVKLGSFFKNAFINPDRYIAELQHRVWSLVEYSQDRGLVNVFLTLTLPSKYHPTRTLRNGQIVRNPKFAHGNIELYDITTKMKVSHYNKMIFRYYKTKKRVLPTGKHEVVSLLEEDYSPAKGSRYLTDMFTKIRKDRSFQDLDKNDRVYFRVTEPHKSGTPHLHISLWIPKENVSRFVQSVHKFFPAPQADISTSFIPFGYELYEKVYKRNGKWNNGYKLHKDDKSYIKLQIDDSVSYLMKYIYKTLDDLRDSKGISEITMWYIFHGICRFYTSRTLMSLNVYRPLGGSLGLLELTKHYHEDTVTVYLDPETKQPKIIQYTVDGIDRVLWRKKDFELKSFGQDNKDYSARSIVRDLDITVDGVDYCLLRGSSLPHIKPCEEDYKQGLERSILHEDMSMVDLWNYYHTLDVTDPMLNVNHVFLVEDTMYEHGLLASSKKVSKEMALGVPVTGFYYSGEQTFTEVGNAY